MIRLRIVLCRAPHLELAHTYTLYLQTKRQFHSTCQFSNASKNCGLFYMCLVQVLFSATNGDCVRNCSCSTTAARSCQLNSFEDWDMAIKQDLQTQLLVGSRLLKMPTKKAKEEPCAHMLLSPTSGRSWRYWHPELPVFELVVNRLVFGPQNVHRCKCGVHYWEVLPDDIPSPGYWRLYKARRAAVVKQQFHEIETKDSWNAAVMFLQHQPTWVRRYPDAHLDA